MSEDEDLKVSIHRTDAKYAGLTGIYVRAQMPDGTRTTVDIAALDAPSLRAWLHSRGGCNPWAESVIALMLAHPAHSLCVEGGR